MGWSAKPVLGVGVDHEDITLQSLTKEALILLTADCCEYRDVEDIEDYFEDNKFDFLYNIGLSAQTGSLVQGWYEYCGVPISITNLDDRNNEYVDAIILFEKFVNIKPVLFSGCMIV